MLRLLLKDLGYKYKKLDDRQYYYEQRLSNLCKMRQNRIDKKPVVFLDETWANAHDGKDLASVEDDAVTGGTLGGVRRPSGKGKRLIILGVGGEMGWIPNTTRIFQSKKDTGDYHDEMTGEHFEEWFREKLLPNIPPNSLIPWTMPHIIQGLKKSCQKLVGISQKCMSGLCIIMLHLVHI